LLRKQVLRRDYFRLNKRAQRGDDVAQDVARSQSARLARKTSLEKLNLSIPQNLPLADQSDNIVELLQRHQVVIVAGETGSGKTTQLPKLCLSLGLGEAGMIGHTQPRRLAARTVAKRIAEEVGTELGDAVGYAVRFSDQAGEQTLLKVMTDGLLLTEIRRDRFLDQYDAIIIDEAHERSLNIDFLLGYLKRLLQRRRDLKVIITSATIDVQRFSEFFDNAPIVAVGGRTYDVEVRYQEQPEDALNSIVDVVEEIESLPSTKARDILVFFSGEREIFEAARALRKQFATRLEVLPLYARLSFAEQQKIFQPTGAKRRIVLATNVAETSLTVPNIGFVIDPGFARINRYSYRSKLQRLPIEPISQASADQRKGRCGRIASGVCYRLYTEHDMQSRPAFTDPEIRRVNLAGVVLQMLSFNLGNIATFPFIDPPDPRAVKDAMLLLTELQALQAGDTGRKEGGKLTDAGHAMARLPVDPRLARMLVEANEQGALYELLIITSGIAVIDPRERPADKAQAADAAHEQFVDERSDFMSWVKLWDWIEQQRQALTRSRFERLLKKHFISPLRVREWRETHRQLRLVCRDLRFKENSQRAGFQQIHEAILSGSLSYIAQHDEEGKYIGARNLKLQIFPGSGLARKRPRWLVASEIVETTRVFARNVGFVEPAWIERQGRHLVRRNYSEPFWSLRRGEVMAFESVTLYGLRLAERRRVSYQRQDPAICRDLFIREALIAGRVKQPPAFLAHNLLQIAQVHDLEAKGRRRDLLVNDDELYAFYDANIPSQISRAQDLLKWARRAKAEELDAVTLSVEMLLQGIDPRGALGEADFPSELVLGDLKLPLKYRFAPGEVDDGVSVDIPVGVLHGVGAEPLEWLVPGLLPNLIEQWLRSLPKSKRRSLAPLPDKLDELVHALIRPEVYRSGRLLTRLAGLLEDRYQLSVGETDWDRDRIDSHLLLYVRIVDETGAVVAASRDIREIKASLTTAPAEEVVIQEDFQDMRTFPAALVLEAERLVGVGAGAQLKFPGLVDAGEHVDLFFFETAPARDVAHRDGLTRLAILQLGQTGQYFRRELDKHPALGLHFASLGSARDLKDELLRGVVWYCFFDGRPLPATETDFAGILQHGRGNLGTIFADTVATFAEIMALRFACRRDVEKLPGDAFMPSREDLLEHIDRLAPRSVLRQTPHRYLRLIERYLRGVERRITQLPGRVPKDRALMAELSPLSDRVERLRQTEMFEQIRYEDLRILLEELRLKMFAEPISRQKVINHPLDQAFFGANWKVSTKRVAGIVLEEERRVGLA
jgi:ATP-dependent helicase HrpA